MYKSQITINGIDSARSFVAMTAKYPDIRITLNHNEYEINAHSIIGILSLDLSKSIEVEAEGDDLEPFINDLKPFSV